MHHIARWIAAFPIKTKMLAGFGCVLIILLCVAGIGYWRFLGVEASFRDYTQRVAVVAISRDIDRDFSELRRHVYASSPSSVRPTTPQRPRRWPIG